MFIIRKAITSSLLFLLASCQKAKPTELTAPYQSDSCRTCLDSYSNSYYCNSESNPAKGGCCPFPTSLAATVKVPLYCIQSIKIGQTCSHQVDTLRKTPSILNYFVCPHKDE